MDPPFSSSRQAFGFAALVAALLLLPLILTGSGLVGREHLYAAVPARWGGFSYIQKQIFEQKGNIDILVLGTSLLYQAIDAPYLAERLGGALGRKSTVITFATNHRCENLNYVLLRDVLARRRIGLLLFSMPVYYQNEDVGHMQSFRWMLDGEDSAALEGLPLRYRFGFRAGTILGAPRHLLSALRPDLYDDSAWSALNGGAKIDLGIRPTPFVRFTPQPPALPAQSMIYGPATSHLFRFTGEALRPYPMHYLKRIGGLLRAYGVPVAIVHVPLWVERHDTVVTERMRWQDVLGARTTLIGVPPATLFRGLSDADIDKLFYNVFTYNNHHFNRNGNEYFTRVITPAIVEIYAQSHSQAN